MDQGENVVEGPELINYHAAVGDNEACHSFSNCSETFSTYSVSSTDSEFIDDEDFLDLLRFWAAKFNITHTELQSLFVGSIETTSYRIGKRPENIDEDQYQL